MTRDKHVNEGVKIFILPTAARATYGAQESNKIQQLVKERLLLTSKESYHKVQVEVKHGSDGNPEALIASMLRTYTYTADIVKVNVDQDFNVKSIEPSIA
jgi:hypothetical protein